MADPKTKSQRTIFAGLAGRFAKLALGASEEDDDKDEKDEKARAEEEERDRKEREEGDAEEDENDKNCSEDERKARKARNEKRRAKGRKAEDDEDEDSPEGKAAAKARGAERGRWAAVLSSRDAQGRVPLACSLLADTDMSAEKICAALQSSPAESRTGGLAARMSSQPRADIGSTPAAAAPDPRSPKAQASAITAAYERATGGRQTG